MAVEHESPELAAALAPLAEQIRADSRARRGLETPDETREVDALRRMLGKRLERDALRGLRELIQGWRENIGQVRAHTDRKRRQFIHDYRKGKPAATLWAVQTEWQERYAEQVSVEAACGLTEVRGNEIAEEIWRRMRADIRAHNRSVDWPEDQVGLVASPVACVAAQAATEHRVPRPWGRAVDRRTGRLW